MLKVIDGDLVQLLGVALVYDFFWCANNTVNLGYKEIFSKENRLRRKEYFFQSKFV